jgi:hypothetical protein
MKKGFTLILLALIFFPASLWGLAWFFSSTNLAQEFCQGEFSLFHEYARCREPYLGLLLSAIVGFISFFLMRSGAKSIRKASQEEQAKSSL